MSQIFSHDQIDVLERMAAICVATDAQDAIAQVQAMADAGHHEAGTLISLWKFWERYEARLASGRHLAAQAVSMMIYEAGKEINGMEVRV